MSETSNENYQNSSVNRAGALGEGFPRQVFPSSTAGT